MSRRAAGGAVARPPWRWAVAGVLAGLLLALLAGLPARWFTPWLAAATGHRLQWHAVSGTVWNGAATPVLADGLGAAEAIGLAEPLAWRLRPAWMDGPALVLALAPNACCLARPASLWLRPALSGRGATVLRVAGLDLSLPAEWLAGLGTPFNTVRVAGRLRLVAGDATLTRQAGRWQMAGAAELWAEDMSTRLSPVKPLGRYRLGWGPATDGRPHGVLETVDGALLVSGEAEWAAAGGWRFRGEARAAPGQEQALHALLNLIGMGRMRGGVSPIGR